MVEKKKSAGDSLEQADTEMLLLEEKPRANGFPSREDKRQCNPGAVLSQEVVGHSRVSQRLSVPLWEEAPACNC